MLLSPELDHAIVKLRKLDDESCSNALGYAIFQMEDHHKLWQPFSARNMLKMQYFADNVIVTKTSILLKLEDVRKRSFTSFMTSRKVIPLHKKRKKIAFKQPPFPGQTNPIASSRRLRILNSDLLTREHGRMVGWYSYSSNAQPFIQSWFL